MNFKTRLFALSVSVLLTLALLCPMLVVGAEEAMSVTAADVYAKRGETVDVVFAVDSNPGFAALMVKIAASEGLEILEIKNGSVMEQMSVGDNILWDSAADSLATGVLFSVSVLVLEDVELDELTVSVEVVQCYNEKLEEVSVDFATATVCVLVDSEATESEKADDEVNTEAADTNEVESNMTVESTPEADDNEESEEKVDDETVSEGGCSSSVGGIATVAVLAGCAVAFLRKKKR